MSILKGTVEINKNNLEKRKNGLLCSECELEI